MPTDDSVLQVALPLPLPRLFDYLPPPGSPAPDAADIGRRLRVPFGPRRLVGVVAGIGGPGPAGAALRPAQAWLEPAPLLEGELLDSLRWLARYTHAPLGEVLATALPAALRRGEPLPDTHAWGWRLTEAGATGLPGLRKGGRPQRLALLLQEGERDEDSLDAAVDDWRAAARALLKRGYAERIALTATLPRTPGGGRPAPHTPNPEQQAAIDAVRAAPGFAPILLDGVTGSGKTEVYLHAIADCLARGRQALVLVPEIGLTPQLLQRFRSRLDVPVHATHSGLGDGERARAWTAALRGEARVVIGTRSAVFTPLPDAGLIVVDEEHDGSYKQLDGIRYHARDFALVRGKALDVPVLLGSATPSLESLHNAASGRYRCVRLSQRAGPARPPPVRMIDVRKRPLDAGVSMQMLDAIGRALDAGGQVLVFRNRRGYAPVLLCHDCGWSAQCPRCGGPDQGRPMTAHAHGRRLQCHHCGHRRPSPPACPDCASLALQPQGAGTERIEESLAARFADVPVLRIDRGSTRRRDALEQHLASLGSAPGILVGTQMLAKGHDLPNLTLVCVVGIDEGLFSADFRSHEKLAQLLIQVAGRAGRADRSGEVLLQTHHPEHPLLATLLDGGYHAFAAGELALRGAAGFPPFAHLALLRAEARHAEPPMAFLHAARGVLEAQLRAQGRPHPNSSPSGGGAAQEPARGDGVRATGRRGGTQGPAAGRGAQGPAISGPVPAPMARRAGLYRAQLLLSSSTRGPLHASLDAAIPAIHELPEARRVRWSLDVDPLDLY